MKKYIIIALIGGFTILHSLGTEKETVCRTWCNWDIRRKCPKSNCRLHQKRQQQSARQSTRNRYRQSIVRQNSWIKCISRKWLQCRKRSLVKYSRKYPPILVDGFPRDLSDISNSEIGSIQILKDAVASALYGVRGGNGVILVTTKRGHNDKLKVTAKYQYGISSQFRKPEFADAYTYANSLNTALALDGLNTRYQPNELDAFKKTTPYPYEYPNVNWWDEVYNKISDNHRLNLTFDGGSNRFATTPLSTICTTRLSSKTKKPTGDIVPNLRCPPEYPHQH